VKIVADGIKSVPIAMTEAATASGVTNRQMIFKVQLPASRKALVLAANQGLIFVLAMVVVGGLVGGGALGYDVINGFAQLQLKGKGLAAGLAIVFMGIALDRITQSSSRRNSPVKA
jgi:glycine betaine/proline transport system permease protein